MADGNEMTISTRRRWARVIMYALGSLAGVLATLYPSTLVSDALPNEAVVIAWSVFMAMSGLVCMVGAITSRWIGEYSGIPLFAATIAVYALAAIHSSDNSTRPLLVYGIIMLSYAAGLYARWRDIQTFKRAAKGHYSLSVSEN